MRRGWGGVGIWERGGGEKKSMLVLLLPFTKVLPGNEQSSSYGQTHLQQRHEWRGKIGVLIPQIFIPTSTLMPALACIGQTETDRRKRREGMGVFSY